LLCRRFCQANVTKAGTEKQCTTTAVDFAFHAASRLLSLDYGGDGKSACHLATAGVRVEINRRGAGQANLNATAGDF